MAPLTCSIEPQVFFAPSSTASTYSGEVSGCPEMVPELKPPVL